MRNRKFVAMLRLRKKDLGSKRIARKRGVSRNTVRRYLRAGGQAPYGGECGRGKSLHGLEGWLGEQLQADVRYPESRSILQSPA